ncbi:MAG: hypothetical protein C5B59_10575 [Bacteroidetes bacterium]|nr:MAG: hypothetical protein C5B59_10575 [Bacteroidota bacterium]
MKKYLTIFIIVLVVGLGIFVYFHFFWVFGEGVKAGTLNYVVKKGFVFKTYEGSLIQTGFKGSTAGTIQSYEFRFSVANSQIANKLMSNSGRDFELHYKEFVGVVPWRGVTTFIVDSIVAMHDTRLPPTTLGQ